MSTPVRNSNSVSPFTSIAQQELPVAVIQTSTDSQSSTLVTRIINQIINNHDFAKETKEYQQHKKRYNLYQNAIYSNNKLEGGRALAVIATIVTLALAIIGLALSGGSVLIIVPVILGAIAAEIGLACLLKDLFDKKIEPYSCDDGYKLGRKISTSKQHLEHMIEEKINNQVDGQKAKFIHNYIMTRINDLYRDSN